MHNDDFSCTLSDETLKKLSSHHLLRRCSVSYKFFISNREFRLVCPLIKTGNQANVVLWPSIKLPFRKYPVYVYLYAVALYLSSDLSMRQVAAKTRQEFSLDKFSHSTLSRALKKLSLIAEELFNILLDFLQQSSKDTQFVVRKHWDRLKQDRYKRLQTILIPVLEKEKAIPYSGLLCFQYYNHTQKFVI